MRPRRILVTIVGTLQSAIGVLAVIFAYILYFDFFDAQARLNTSVELLPFYLFAVIVFGFFSIISGLFLLYEGRESR